jgi:hypothetical protein
MEKKKKGFKTKLINHYNSKEYMETKQNSGTHKEKKKCF